ncbi:hypothetical protein [Cerasicoccus arenae]|uniref:Uncharacterized protein n=1 Tax=Cerasicoccus arenae TaxID=424488 RepID=A0A8J3GDY1_9BACT|nr:hypothetical protein [Cerasicoccus arenae]MBK1857476.1 hypothetical protein [Cerasicoccus arenae]GHB95248.1 hypothetical protein GCM10007047_08660 [Cerasicoccus arenae]
MKNHHRHGNSIMLVLIIATALGAVVFAALRLVRHESSLNKRANLYHEARLASETLLQASFADLQNRFDSSVAFPKDELSPDKNPLGVPSEFITRYIGSGAKANTNLVSPSVTKYTSMDQFESEPVEIIGGPVPPGDWRFIDPNVPGNENDPLAGTMTFVRGIEILAKATVTRKGWAENTTAYTRQLLEVRDAPLFAHAIFYNLPMEIAPGPSMNIYGNVHANGDMFIQAGSDLTFHEKVTTSGDIFHGRRSESGQSTSNGSVKFTNRDGDLISMKEDNTWEQDARELHSGDWLESTANNWESIASQLFDGNLLNKSHGISQQNPVGVMEYVEDTDDSTSAQESLNYAYQLIQPTLTKTELTIPDPSVSQAAYEAAVDRNEVEKQKFAYKAGLTVSVNSAGNVSMHYFERDSDGSIKYDETGKPNKINIHPKSSFITVENFASTGSGSNETVTSGMHDKREGADLNMVNVDVGALKTILDKNDVNDWSSGGAPSDWWNGVVYVEFPEQNATSNRPDNVNPAIEGWGVKITNAKEIPNPTFAQSNGIYGTSFATNQAMYIDGHYNADGDPNTGSPTEPDSSSNFASSGAEAPSALVADAITFLSTNWDDANSTKSKDSNRVASNFTEVSAAILAGIVPSGETGSNSYSGGVENFPRFLEKWSGKTLRIRGSIVALFESEVSKERWGKGDVYDAPNRNWGFHEKLGEGYYPPGTPSTRTYRGRDYRDLNEEEYKAAVAEIKANLTSS